MKIVVLDGYSANPGDLSWSEMEKLGDLKVYPRTSENKVVEYAKDAEIILLNKVKITCLLYTSSDFMSRFNLV